MEKTFGFTRSYPYIILNCIGFLALLLCIFHPDMGYSIFFYAGPLMMLIYNHTLFSLICIFISAIISFLSVKNNKTLPGIIFSLLLGAAGGFAAVNTVNNNFSKAVTINIIFNIHVWILICCTAVTFEMPVSIFLLIPFVFTMTAGIFALKAPLKIMMTVNASVSLAAAAVLFPITIIKSWELMRSNSVDLLLTILMLLLILLPNMILFIVFRKNRKTFRFGYYVRSSVLLSLCHIPSIILIFTYIIFFFTRFLY